MMAAAGSRDRCGPLAAFEVQASRFLHLPLVAEVLAFYICSALSREGITLQPLRLWTLMFDSLIIQSKDLERCWKKLKE
jgi:hypothetical protein